MFHYMIDLLYEIAEEIEFLSVADTKYKRMLLKRNIVLKT